MTLHTPLTVKERWRHTHDVFPDANRTQPFGSGATVVYNYVDLQIKNDTPYEYQLKVWVGDKDLEGEWRSEQPCPFKYQIYESEHLIKQEWWGDYMRHNVIRRGVFDPNDNKISDEFVTENNAIMMYEPLLSENIQL
jgi:vancomycin resistance protein VanW